MRSSGSAGVLLPVGKVEGVMTRNILTLDRRTSVADAARALDRTGLTSAPIVEGDHYVGTITVRDLVERPSHPSIRLKSGSWLRGKRGGSQLDMPVDLVMSRRTPVAHPDMPLQLCALTMEEAGVGRLNVVDGSGKLVGVVARDAVLSAIGHRVHLPEAASAPVRA
jgi:CBS domain-containing protein